MTARNGTTCPAHGPEDVCEVCDPVSLLSRHALFDGLDRAVIGQIAGMSAALDLPAGARIFRQNDPSDGLYIVERGEIGLMARVPGDGLVELERPGPGMTFGEFCLLDGGLRSAEARVMAPARLRRIDRHRFDTALLGMNPGALEIRTRLMHEVARRTRATLGALGSHATGAAERRRPLASSVPPASVSPDSSRHPSRNPSPNAGPMPMPDPRALLGTFPGFDAIAPQDWPTLAAALRCHRMPRGQRAADPDAPRDGLLIVARGALRTALPADGALRQVMLHGPGAITNAATFTDALPCPGVIEAREDAVVFELPRAALESWPPGALSEAMMRLLGVQMTRDLRRLTREMARLGSSTDTGTAL